MAGTLPDRTNIKFCEAGDSWIVTAEYGMGNPNESRRTVEAVKAEAVATKQAQHSAEIFMMKFAWNLLGKQQRQPLRGCDDD
jgi:hypothetical protein